MEGTSFITPINRIESIGQTPKVEKVKTEDEAVSFGDIFGNMINNVRETEADLAIKQYQFATGEIDDIHAVTIASTKAQLSVDLLVQLRNKAIDSYSELMRMSI